MPRQPDSLEVKTLKYITKHPGKRGEEIRIALGEEDGDKFSRLMAKLRASKAIKGKGTTRAMTYTATAKA